jgi:hypothetical protein
LRVQLELKPENIEALSYYFAVGFSGTKLLQTMKILLGKQLATWVDLQDLFPNWIQQRANTFVQKKDKTMMFVLPGQENSSGTKLLQMTCLLLGQPKP